MENVLLAGEIEIYIQNMESKKINDIGNPMWLQWHQRLLKLNQQAVMEASVLREESVKEILVSYGKLNVLVHEAISILVWRKKVLPHLLNIEPDPDNTIILYSALYHEAICIATLEIVLFHSDSCEVLNDNAIDLLDYSCELINNLFTINNNYEDEEKDLDRQRNELNFNIAIRCISIIRYLSENLDKLPLSVTSRLFSTHDVPVMFAELLDKKPWTKFDKKGNYLTYIDGKWTPTVGEAKFKLSKTEGQVWLTLRQLLLDPKLSTYYEISSHRKTQLLKLQRFMNENLYDQLSVLVELQQWLCHLSITEPKNAVNRPVLLEVIPEIKQSLLNQGRKKWKAIAKEQSKWFFNLTHDDLVKLAQNLSESYNADLLEQMDETNSIVCAGCGGKAIKKCSQCKSEWYCGRQCQVKHWPQHKELCLSKKAEETSDEK